MTARPLRIFIGSASEGLDVANAVRDVLEGYTNFKPIVWNAGTFKLSQTFVESLERELVQSDFAVLTLTPDDGSTSRGQLSLAPRDNVLFELGLFMGRLGRERTYFLLDKNQDLKIPTDLLGVNPAIYELSPEHTLHEALIKACSSIAEQIMELGGRQKHSPEVEFENKMLADFCKRAAGTWWGRQWPSEGDDMRLALLRIISDHETNTLRLEGDTFNNRGTLFARWRSVAIGLRVKERTLVWAWEGTHPTLAPGETFGGFGQYTFEDTPGIYERAEGFFADIQKGRKKPAGWTSLELRRVAIADLDRVTRVMKSGSDSARASEVIKALESITRAGDQTDG